MKVLWFSNTPSLYDQNAHHYHGGGWIASLEKLIADRHDIELAIAFFHPHDGQKVTRCATTYYPLCRPTKRRARLRQVVNNWRGELADGEYSKHFIDIINDFKPDIIQVFGSEGPFGEIQALTKKPVVIHLQGLVNPYLNTYFPAGCSGLEFVANRAFLLETLKGGNPLLGRRLFAQRAQRERHILKNSRYVMGRTHWDEMIAKLYNPDVMYFHVDEVLRELFYEHSPGRASKTSALQILSTLSPTIYKGIDVLLRTARQLKQLPKAEFSWKVAGLNSADPLLRHFEQKEGIDHRSVGIECLGKQSAHQLGQLMSHADVFVHPSYIDNSPNSVCEAQMLGLPVIACDVGGLSTLIRHQQTGMLVPSNGVFELTHYLKLLANNAPMRASLGENARKAALLRHDKEAITQNLLAAYNTIVDMN